MADNDLTSYIDDWLDENAWRLDARVLDFVLDVRLLAQGEDDREGSEARRPVGVGSAS
jgi:hypothetical protein